MIDPDRDISATLSRIADALERLAPPAAVSADPAAGSAFVWSGTLLRSVAAPRAQPLDRLLGIDSQKAAVLENSRRHARGLPAHDILLWGSRGMGKSALVKSAHAALAGEGLALVEIARDDLASLPALFRHLGPVDRRFLLFIDDLSFEANESEYKALRSVLEGGVEARPDNCRLYVTSNRRHLVPRDAAENEAASAINPRDVIDDRLALSDRFGLSLGFHACDQPTYLAIVRGYAEALGLPYDEADALAWSVGRGSRSGRVAWQYVQELAGREGVALP
jgi:predicted AAA+ superfamily ATPase